MGGVRSAAGNQNDKNIPQTRVTLDLFADLHSVEVWQQDIQQDQIGALFACQLKTVLAS